MRISRKSEYAIRSLVAMARHQRSWNIQELSSQEAIPVKFLEQILLAMRHAGYLSAKRGVGGGYTLRVKPAQISVGDVIRAMDGPIAPVPCAAPNPTESCTCPHPRTCSLRQLMNTVRVEISAILDAKTIDDLAHSDPDAALAFDI
jgi:Rrf2 family protein